MTFTLDVWSKAIILWGLKVQSWVYIRRNKRAGLHYMNMHTQMHHNVIDLSLSITVCLVTVWQLDQLSHKGLMWSVSCFMLSLFVFSVWCLWPILELTVVIVPLNTLQTCHFGGYNCFLDMTVPRHLFTIYTFLFGKCVITYFTGFCNFYKVVKECVLSLLTILQ